MKKTLKAVLAALLVVCLLLPLAACGNNATTETKLKIAIPNDTTNEARALLLLQDQGYIKLKDGHCRHHRHHPGYRRKPQEH